MGNTDTGCLSSIARQTAFHDAKAKSDRALKSYDYHVDATLSDRRLSSRSARFLERLWYADERSKILTLAQRPVRKALSQAVVLVLLRHCESDRNASCGPDRLRLLSTCPNVGYCNYAGGKLQFTDVRRHSRRAMMRRSLEGLAMPDLALVDVEGRGAPRSIGIHFHAACSPCPGADPTTPAGKAWKETNRRNQFNLAVVRQDVRKSPLNMHDVAGLGHYVAKVSAGLKEAHDSVTRGSQKLWSREHALRALEVYSHVSPGGALVGVGELGKRLKKDCSEAFEGFLGWGRKLHGEIDHRELRRGWDGLYSDLNLDLRPLRVE